MLTETELISVIDRHLAATGESASAFGKRLAGDPNLVSDLRSGRSPRMSLAHLMLAEVQFGCVFMEVAREALPLAEFSRLCVETRRRIEQQKAAA